MVAVMELAGAVGVEKACESLAVSRASYYRWRRPLSTTKAAGEVPLTPPPNARPAPQRALAASERATVRALLDGARFVDKSPRQAYATLLDENVYHCHWRTMYRILAAHGEVKERRDQLQRPAFTRPELLATGPNQLWSWDITKLRGPRRGQSFFLYVLLDVFSRYVVAWLVAERECQELAAELLDAGYTKQGIGPAQLIVHSDRGAPMTAKSVAELLVDLGVRRSLSRPHVPDDNPYSEAQFRTMKYNPDFPDRFGGIGESRSWCARFFRWYNHEHHHSGLALLTPACVHAGRTAIVIAQRQAVIDQAYAAHPERFVNGAPRIPAPPMAVWINPPLPPSPPGDHPALTDPSHGAELVSRVAEGQAPAALDTGEHRGILTRVASEPSAPSLQ